MRHQTLKADIFTLVYNTALQEFQYANLNPCLTNTFQQNGYLITQSEHVIDKKFAEEFYSRLECVFISIKISEKLLLWVPRQEKN